MKKVIICPPVYFDIEYEINPWMHVGEKVVKDKAYEVYNELKRVYQFLPVELFEMEPVSGLPDMVYMADSGHVQGDTFIRANFRYPERRPEAFALARWMQEKFNFKVAELPEGIFFEGHGDFVPARDVYFMGWGKRSMREAIPYLDKYLDKPLIGLELIDPYYYHLDTCFSVLTADAAVINQASFKPEGLREIHRHFKKVIEASTLDHQVLGCNLVVVDNHIIVAQGITAGLRKEFTDLGFTIHEIDTTEYRKGGGSVKCMSFEF